MNRYLFRVFSPAVLTTFFCIVLLWFAPDGAVLCNDVKPVYMTVAKFIIVGETNEESKNLINGVRLIFENSLMESKRISLLEREHIDMVTEEIGLKGPYADLKEHPKLGKILKLEKLVVGHLFKASKEILSITVIDLRVPKVELTLFEEVRTDEASEIYKAAKNLAQRIVRYYEK
jgi:hypothetical protein